MSIIQQTLSTAITNLVGDVSVTGWAVFFVMVAIFAASALRRPVGYSTRNLSRSERRMIRQYRERKNTTHSYLDNKGKKVSKDQFYAGFDDASWRKYLRDNPNYGASKKPYYPKKSYNRRPARGFSDTRYKNPDLTRGKTYRTKNKTYYKRG